VDNLAPATFAGVFICGPAADPLPVFHRPRKPGFAQSPPRLPPRKMTHFRRMHRSALCPAPVRRSGTPQCSGQTQPDAAKARPDASRSRLNSRVPSTDSNRQQNGKGGPFSPAPRSSLPACTARLMQWFSCTPLFALRSLWLGPPGCLGCKKIMRFHAQSCTFMQPCRRSYFRAELSGCG